MNAYEYIKREIILNNFKEGELFNDNLVAQNLGISRTPVREAVLKLAGEGYLTIIPRKGTLISKISFQDIKQLYDYRLILEPESMITVCRLYDKAIAKKWKDYFKRVIENDAIDIEDELVEENYLGIIDSDYTFHISLASSLNNKYILNEITKVMDVSMRVRHLSDLTDKNRKIEALEEHIKLIDAIIEENGIQAKEIMKKHLENSIKRYNF